MIIQPCPRSVLKLMFTSNAPTAGPTPNVCSASMQQSGCLLRLCGTLTKSSLCSPSIPLTVPTVIGGWIVFHYQVESLPGHVVYTSRHCCSPFWLFGPARSRPSLKQPPLQTRIRSKAAQNQIRVSRGGCSGVEDTWLDANILTAAASGFGTTI